LEEPVRLVLMMMVLTATGCYVHAGPPRRRYPFWHRHPRAEVTVAPAPEAANPPSATTVTE